MSAPKYTKGEWYATGWNVCAKIKDVLRGPLPLVCKCAGASDAETKANAERIAKCANACKGIPDPETVVPELVEFAKEVARLTSVYSETSLSFGVINTKAEALLVKVEGGAL